MFLVTDYCGCELFLTEDYDVAYKFCYDHGLDWECISEY